MSATFQCGLNPSKTGVEALCQIQVAQTIIDEDCLLKYHFTKAVQTVDDALKQMAVECLSRKLTPKVLRDKYYLTMKKSLPEDESTTAKEQEIICILRMYIHMWASGLGFDVNAGIALHPICGKMNHSCNPNALLLFLLSEKDECMAHCVALRDIQKGEEIRINYTFNSQLSSHKSRQGAFRSNITMHFDCDCLQCKVEKNDMYRFNDDELFLLFEECTNNQKHVLKTLISLPVQEYKPGYLTLFLELHKQFRPATQKNYNKHLRCAMDFDVQVVERLSRLFVYNTDSKDYVPQMIEVFESMPKAFWHFVEQDVRFSMRLVIVMLACYALRLDSALQIPLFQWVLQRVKFFIRFKPFMTCVIDNIMHLPALKPAMIALPKILTLIK